MNVWSALAPARCPDCQGTGRNGTIGGYALVCRLCYGVGERMLTFAHR
jgi:hypothetical protein